MHHIETTIVRDGADYVINGRSGGRQASAIRAARSRS